VRIGSLCADLYVKFGPPADKQVYDAAGYHDETWSYNDVTDSGDFTIPQYMFDCENGSITSKSNM